MAGRHNNNNDDDDLLNYLAESARTGNIQARCDEFLDDQTFRRKLYFESEEDSDVLELYAPPGLLTIQKILQEQTDLDRIELRGTAPALLPIIITKVYNDDDSIIIPSASIAINCILSRAPIYQLEGIICEINQRKVIFMKNLTTDHWYYYQRDRSCEQLNQQLRDNLNDIIESRSANEQKRLIQSAHFLVSMVFYNAVKYIYKQED